MNYDQGIKDFLHSSDPLSKTALDRLLAFREEDELVDFKETFDPAADKSWLDLTKDVMAFANTSGGYLMFGIRDGTYEKIGLDENVARTLADTNKLLQKINRHVDPDITTLRSKAFAYEGKRFVAVSIPSSTDKTHMVSKDGAFKFASGKDKTILREGTFYVRRSGGNHLGDSRDFEDIVNRRIGRFKESLVNKLARVVEAPPESEVLVLSKQLTGDAEHRFIIENAPDAIPVKGMSFTASPVTPEQEVAAWIAMWRGDPAAIPPTEVLWRWYKDRRKLELTPDQHLGVAEFSLLAGVPAFFWLRGANAESIKRMLNDAVTRPVQVECVESLVGTAAFLGKGFHRQMVGRLAKRRKLSSRTKKLPQPNKREMFHPAIVESKRPKGRNKTTEANFQAQLEKDLDSIAASVGKERRPQPGVLDRVDALATDCYLYAQDDKYASRAKAENK